jgi:hypothetical protein
MEGQSSAFLTGLFVSLYGLSLPAEQFHIFNIQLIARTVGISNDTRFPANPLQQVGHSGKMVDT